MNPWRTLFGLLLGRRLPKTHGSVTLAGLQGSVRIRREAHGVPVIEAEDEDDAWLGLGFCQGQDRAFQLEQLRRAAHGTVAELAGERGLALDRFTRRLGLLRAAREQLGALPEEDRRTLEAFARGVNAGRGAAGSPRRAHEFALLRRAPDAFEPADVVALMKLVGFALSAGWQAELARLAVLREDGAEALFALDPSYPEWLPVAAPPGAPAGPALARVAEDFELLRGQLGLGGGSNNWALAPSRTQHGAALLANDPHLPPTLPPLWYLAHVRTPRFAVAGASLIGAPGIAVGHNGRAAWGFTTGQADDTDLFLEELGPDGRSVREGSDFVPCEVSEERFLVRGAAPVTETVLRTPRGPIVTPALPGVKGALSLRSMSAEARPFRLPRPHLAQDVEGVRRAFSLYPFSSLNLMMADAAGGIAWQLIGQLPRRRKGFGTLPLPGWDPGVGWEPEPVPFEAMPHARDPEQGFLATANAKPTHDGDGPFLGADWNDGYRQQRIAETLGARRDWDVDATLAFQLDQLSIPWRELREHVLAAPQDDPDAREALALLAAWDGVVSAESPAAALFELFLAELERRVVRALAPRATEAALGRSFSPVGGPAHTLALRRVGHLVRCVREGREGVFAAGWPREIARSLATAWKTLRMAHGNDPTRWAWGTLRPLRLRHPLGSAGPLAHVFDLGPFPWGGDAHTVGQSSPSPLDPLGDPIYIATLRMVVDLGDVSRSRFVLAGGQSGNPLSPHYGDLVPLWRRGEGIAIPWTPDEVAAAARAELVLEPLR